MYNYLTLCLCDSHQTEGCQVPVTGNVGPILVRILETRRPIPHTQC